MFAHSQQPCGSLYSLVAFLSVCMWVSFHSVWPYLCAIKSSHSKHIRRVWAAPKSSFRILPLFSKFPSRSFVARPVVRCFYFIIFYFTIKHDTSVFSNISSLKVCFSWNSIAIPACFHVLFGSLNFFYPFVFLSP